MFFLIHRCSFNLYCCHKCFIIQVLKLCIMIPNSIEPFRIGHWASQMCKIHLQSMARMWFPCLKGRYFFGDLCPNFYVLFSQQSSETVIMQKLTEIILDYTSLQIFSSLSAMSVNRASSHNVYLFLTLIFVLP